MNVVLMSERIEVDNDPEALLELSLTEQWGDGAPFIPPTDERIEAMLAGTPRVSTDIVAAEVPPRHGMATVELIAFGDCGDRGVGRACIQRVRARHHHRARRVVCDREWADP